MGMGGRFELNLDLDGIKDLLESGGEHGIKVATELVLTEANRQVPLEEGTLQRSGHASVDGTKGAVSYDTPYAVRQHEDMSLRHEAGRRAKYLETALTGNAGAIRQVIATALRAQLGG